jgi:hypothetical protein
VKVCAKYEDPPGNIRDFLEFVKDCDTVPWPSSSMLRFLGFSALRRVTALNVICLRPVLHSVPLRKKTTVVAPGLVTTRQGQ